MRRLAYAFTLLAVLFIAGRSAADERAAAAYNAARGGVSFVVLRDGTLAYEDYPNGGARERAWELASGTKSFWGVAAAAAVKDGMLTLDERAADTLAEWRDDPLKASVTLRQLLSLTSALKPAPIGRPPAYTDAIAAPAVGAPGSRFDYGPLNFQIFGEVLRRKLRRFEGGRYATPLDYLQARILDPLGIAPAQWNRGPDGNPTLPSGADLAARDWARFGEFVRLGGRWNGEALVDAAALAECFKGSSANAAYGLAWWLNRQPSADALAAARTMLVATDFFTNPRRGALPKDLFMAAGAGDQRLYVIPSLKLVVVRQQPKLFLRRRGGGDWSDVDFLLALLD